MNEAILTRLKIIVERAVRPVRASTFRKQKMREELLAHLTAVFEEELASHGDEQIAVQRADERFGKPADLTARLQESMPAKDRLDRFLESIMARIFPPGESNACLALRHAVLVVMLWMTTLACAGTDAWTATFWLFGGSVAASAFLMTFELYVLADWMRQALFGPEQTSWRRATLIAMSAAILFPVNLIPNALFGPATLTLNVVLLMSLMGPAMVTALCIVGHGAVAKARRVQEWASLDIGLDQGASA